MLRGENTAGVVVQETGLAATDTLDMCSRETRRLLWRPERKQQSSLVNSSTFCLEGKANGPKS